MSRPDPHSYFDETQPRTTRLDLDLRVDFARRIVEGSARFQLDRDGAGPWDLDTRGLVIREVRAAGIPSLPHTLQPVDPILGQRLRIHLPPGVREVEIRYRTTTGSTALQWLTPEQTGAKQHPFLFSQCQAIHARSLVPCQDTPRVRIPYRAALTVPRALTAVMSAGAVGVEPLGDERIFRFEMPQPIPPYLLALAVGELESRELSPRSRIWAEPPVIEAAAFEFPEVEEMIVIAEALFGPYDWERYDLLVLPPSFPYGGMENPRLTFLTPTVIAGDRSLVDVVAHELAHSWTGNLVTNADAEHFWLNEGWTVWAERRILEALRGPEVAELSWVLGSHLLATSIQRFGADSPLTRLRTELQGIDPDEAYSAIPYEKGARLLTLLEREVGRPRWDEFVRTYLSRFRFGSLTTEQFVEFLNHKLPGAGAAVDAESWLYGAGLPANTPAFRSDRVLAVRSLAQGFPNGQRPEPAEREAWSAAELLLYLQELPRPLAAEELHWLDETFVLGRSGNHELLVEWLHLALQSDYEPAFARAHELLISMGRMRYLRPLYTALGKSARTRQLGRAAHAEALPGYHPISRRLVESLIAAWPED